MQVRAALQACELGWVREAREVVLVPYSQVVEEEAGHLSDPQHVCCWTPSFCVHAHSLAQMLTQETVFEYGTVCISILELFEALRTHDRDRANAHPNESLEIGVFRVLLSSEKASAKKIKAKENKAKANPELAAKNKAESDAKRERRRESGSKKKVG
ncbi:MAG: hypothetical protein WDW38_006411 [Sanguina aurantia]